MRQPIEAKKASGLQLTESIGITPTSVSQILNGQSRPRQFTLTRIMKRPCETKEQERHLVAAFAGTELLDEESDQVLPSAEKKILRLRAEQFLERKTQSIQFKRSVARELDKAGITYQQDYCEGIYSTDFLIEQDRRRIALECKANVDGDIKKTIAQAELIGDKLQCQVWVVTPFIDGVRKIRSTGGVKLFAVSELLNYF